MNIPRYWVRAKGQVPTGFGKVYDLVAWGWSSEGRDGAERKAQERLAAFAQRVQQGLDLPRGYAYGDRPLREEILREIQGSDGEIEALVTRNSYGSMVLNTAHTLFADVDLPAASSGPSFLGRLFGKSEPARRRRRWRGSARGSSGPRAAASGSIARRPAFGSWPRTGPMIRARRRRRR